MITMHKTDVNETGLAFLGTRVDDDSVLTQRQPSKEQGARRG